MKKVQIVETYKTNLSINESTDGLIHMTGLFGETGTRNRNGRIYSKENYSEMVELLQPEVKRGLLGELNHPMSLSIDLNNVSHKIDSLVMNEDGTCTGEITLLSTPKGNIAKALVEAGLPIYVSSRGCGEIDEDGNVTLTHLVTWDIVSTPGVANAKFDVKESLYESLDDDLYIIKEDEDDEKKEEKTEKETETEKEDESDKKEETDDEKKEVKESDEPKSDEPKSDEPKSDEPKEIDYTDLINQINEW